MCEREIEKEAEKSIFLIEKPVFNGFLKIIGTQNQLTITFYSDLV